MARLNEPPPSAESLESLKRRFVRQNRDLARSNSTQSVTIRQQQQEISHLLSENASLRQRILQLENELALSPSDDIRSGVDVLRQRIEAQLRDFTKHVSGSLNELSTLQKKPKRRKSQLATSPKRSPARREWKNTSTLCEVLASQGQTMPTIMENKSYPRRTLGVEDFQDVQIGKPLDLRESPEVERPITFLDREDGVLVDPSTEASQETGSNGDTAFLASVEIRRKRRHSSLLSDSSDPQDVAQHPLKAGAKRKFAVPGQRSEPASVAASDRRILSEKSINTDLFVSPRKSVSPAKKPAPLKPGAALKKATAIAIPTKANIQDPPEVIDVPTSYDDVDIKSEPITPGLGLSLFSPPSTQPSSEGEPKGRPATPPPASDTGSIGRGLRRSRTAVSYAEPKLNVKMRRPGKEMSDAVIKREASVDRESQGEPVTESQRVVHIKREATSTKAPTEEGGVNDTLSPSHGRDKPINEPGSIDAAVVNEPPQIAPSRPQMAEDIFEVDASPPKRLPDLQESSKPSTAASVPTLAPRITASRRTSVASAASSTSGTARRTAQAQAPRPASAEPRISSGSLRRARRQTLGGTANSEVPTIARPASVASGSVTKELKTSRSVANMSSAANEKVNGVDRIGVGEGKENLRAERAARIADRRRSMML